jgi:hypothetical protein
MPPRRGAVFKQRPQRFGRSVGRAVNIFQRGGFYAAAPWRGIQATPSIFRARLLGGGDASIQRGGFYAAAPWRGIQATPSTFRARLLGGGDASIQRGGFYAAAPWQGF